MGISDIINEVEEEIGMDKPVGPVSVGGAPLSPAPVTPKKRARKYNFTLPVVVPSFKANFVPGILKDDKLWDKIPADIQNAFLNHGWDDVTITKQELDEIDDDTWAKIKAAIAKMGA